MTTEWSARNLDLKENQAQKASSGLKAGRHAVRCVDYKLADTGNGNQKQLALSFVALDGSGATVDRMTIFDKRTGENYQTAVRIGKDRLKSYLTYSSYPTPDVLQEFADVKNRVVGIVIEDVEEMLPDKQDPSKPDRLVKMTKPKKSGSCYFPPSEIGAAPGARAASVGLAGAAGEAAPAQAAQADLDDDIPF